MYQIIIEDIMQSNNTIIMARKQMVKVKHKINPDIQIPKIMGITVKASKNHNFVVILK